MSILTILVGLAFAGTAARAEPAEPSERSQLSGRLAEELRLGAIGYRLATANADRCAKPEMLSGMMLHDVGGYDAATRPEVMRAYRLTTGFGLLQLVPGGSAERAGFQAGDEILALNGADLTNFAPEAITGRASPDRTERFVDLLAAALRAGPATLAVRRAGSVFSLSLEGERGCGGRFVVAHGERLNAWTDGYYVAVTSRMMRYAANDQELAFVVAHEMAHNLLGHVETRDSAPGIARGKAAEAEADALAIELLAEAGYDLSAPEIFLRRTARSQWLNLQFTHPSNSQRVRLINATIARLAAPGRAAAPMLAAMSGCRAGSDEICRSEGNFAGPAASESMPDGEGVAGSLGQLALPEDRLLHSASSDAV